MSEQPVSYYDKAASHRNYKRHYTKAPWFYIWVELGSFIHRNDKVLDCGCGAGQFARMLWDLGHLRYTGIDFSDKMIQSAENLVLDNPPHGRDFRFFLHDLRDGVPPIEYDVAVFCEVLEHITMDREVIASIHSKKHILFSVPNYMDPGHVRVYRTAAEVRERYQDLMGFDRLFYLPRPDKPRYGVWIGYGPRH